MEGNVKVSFRVNTRGRLENLQIKSDFPILNKAVEELVAGMKDWYPAVSHNRIVDSDEEFVIPFYLRQ